MSVTISVLSQKGGTGKTTTVRSIADVLSRIGLDVLAIDADPQGNLSDYFDVDPSAQPTLGEVLAGQAEAADAIHGPMIPANLGLAEAEQQQPLRRYAAVGIDQRGLAALSAKIATAQDRRQAAGDGLVDRSQARGQAPLVGVDLRHRKHQQFCFGLFRVAGINSDEHHFSSICSSLVELLVGVF